MLRRRRPLVSSVGSWAVREIADTVGLPAAAFAHVLVALAVRSRILLSRQNNEGERDGGPVRMYV